MSTALLTGLGLGLAVAAQVGPVSLLLVRTVLRGATSAGLAIGLGAAVVDVAYAAAGSAGAAGLLEVAALRTTLGLLGSAVLVVLGLRALQTVRRPLLAGDLPAEIATPTRALRTSLAATASNPMTIAAWTAVFLATTTAELTRGAAGTGLLLLGIGLGTLIWFTALTGVVRLVRGRVTDRGLRGVDIASGLGLVAFGVVLAVRVL
ncbi:MAG: LysE family transporter [Mycobacteriales bacterium]|nr:LysE family transporter [Mycobacteriales bacterium]